MSTSETVEFDKGPCPCGNGRLIQYVTTQDNPWSTADVAYEIDCSKCNTEWRIDSRWLVLRASEAPHARARATEAIAYRELRTLETQLVDKYFAELDASSKKAEHRELERLGISSMSYRQYLSHKSAGGSPGSAAYPRRNEMWLRSLAIQNNSGNRLDDLISQADNAKAAAKSAASQIVRRPIA